MQHVGEAGKRKHFSLNKSNDWKLHIFVIMIKVYGGSKLALDTFFSGWVYEGPEPQCRTKGLAPIMTSGTRDLAPLQPTERCKEHLVIFSCIPFATIGEIFHFAQSALFFCLWPSGSLFYWFLFQLAAPFPLPAE